MKTALTKASIFKKIAFVSVSILVVTAIIVNIAILFIKQGVEKELTSFGNKILEFYSDSLETQIRTLEEHSFALMQQASFQEPLKRISTLDNSSEVLSAQIELSLALQSEPVSLSAVNGLMVVDTLGTATGRYQKNLSPAMLETVVEHKGAVVWCSLPDDTGEIALCRAIRSVRNDFQYWDLGVLLLILDLEQLTNSDSLQGNFYDSILTITNATGDVLYTGARETTGITVGAPLAAEDLNTESDILLTRTLENTGWCLYLTIPKTNIFSNINAIANTQHMLFILVFCLAILLSILFASRVTLPLRHLQMAMQKVGGGDFDIDSAYLTNQTGHDEIGTICQSFVNTTERLQTLINENYIAQIEQKDAQFRALQAQIDPHFIYNTLDSVNWLAKMNQQHTIASTVQSLSHLMRSAVTNDTSTVTLEDELALVRDYIDIQQLRFGSRLVYQEGCEEATLQQRLPRLILQPIIENSIKYGTEGTDAACEVTLSAYAPHPNVVEIVIKDNGPGIKELNANNNTEQCLPRQNAGGTNIGIYNVKRRLELLYGDRASLRLCNIAPHGLAVHISIEAEQGEYL